MPATAPPAPAIIVSGPAGAQQGTITLDVNAQSLPGNTYGVLFDLDFNPSLVTFASHQAGAFFGSGGMTSYQVATDPANRGKLIVGVMVLGASSGVSGSGRIVSLRFNLQSNTGSTTLAFGTNALHNPSGQAIGGVSWAAGTIQVSR